MGSSGRQQDVVVCAAALAVTGLTAVVAGRHPRADRRLFAAVNHRGGELAVLRVLQQAGTPWVLPATALVAALARPLPRPLYVEPTVLRDDAPVEGESFPSGHAAIAFAGAVLVLPDVPHRVGALLLVVAAGSALVRVSQGAHHLADAVGGAALGTAVANGLNACVGRTAQLGIRSSLSFRLFTCPDRTWGALNVHSTEKDGFSDEDVLQGQTIAALAAVALARSLNDEQLASALETRTAIGQAIGIVMERYEC